MTVTTGNVTTFERGRKFFELSNHLGNVLVTVSDRKIRVDANSDGVIDYYTADVISATDYYPFGMNMPQRSFTSGNSGYRYGFNGKEDDKETKTQDYGLRVYNPAIGKFLSVDPLTQGYPFYSPYHFAGNSPIANIDLDGGEPKPAMAPEGTSNGTTKITTKAIVINLPAGQPGSTQCFDCKEEAINATLKKTWYWHSGKKLINISADWYSKEDYDVISQDWENGQVLQPGKGPHIAKYTEKEIKNGSPQFWGTGGRDWNGWQVDDNGYLTGNPYYEGELDIRDAIFRGGVGKGGKITRMASRLFNVAGAWHHIATNKNFIRGMQWSLKFLPLFKKAGYKLSDAINKVFVKGHYGPHPDQYHKKVFDRLNTATKGLTGSKYKEVFEKTLTEIGNEAAKKGTELNKLITK